MNNEEEGEHMTIQVPYKYERVGESYHTAADILRESVTKVFHTELGERPPKYIVTDQQTPETALYEGNWLLGVCWYVILNKAKRGPLCAWMLID